MQMKNSLTHIVNYEKKIRDKFEKCNMTRFNLGKTLKHLKIQESLRSENLTEYWSFKGIFLYAFLYHERYYTNTKWNKSLN